MPPKAKPKGFLCTPQVCPQVGGRFSRLLRAAPAPVTLPPPAPRPSGPVGFPLRPVAGPVVRSVLPIARPVAIASPGSQGLVSDDRLHGDRGGASSSGDMARRRDHPVVAHTIGAKRVRLTTSDPSLHREELLEALNQGVYAKSTLDSQASLLNTWKRMHAAWFGTEEDHPPFPLSPSSIRAVASIMKDQKYRSWSNCLCRARREHVALGNVWSAELDMVARQCTRSVNRGIGPARQSAPYDVKAIQSLDTGIEPVISKGPVNPCDMLVLGAFFLTREIELSAAKASHLEFHTGSTVTWLLPASKTDPTAVGVRRQWGCVCKGDVEVPCAWHSALRHMDTLRELFGVKRAVDNVGHCANYKLGRLCDLPDDLPLFPDVCGHIVSKAAMVSTITILAGRTGAATTDEHGRNAFGGHSCRVSGAKFLSGLGLELYKLALLARWSSPVILRYVGEAPLRTVTDDCRRLLAGAQLHTLVEDLNRRVEQNLVRLEAISVIPQESLRLEATSTQVHRTVDHTTPCLLNLRSGMWHVDLEGRTVCGWKHLDALITKRVGLPPNLDAKLLCDKCFATLRSQKVLGSHGLDSATASSSSTAQAPLSPTSARLCADFVVGDSDDESE